MKKTLLIVLLVVFFCVGIFPFIFQPGKTTNKSAALSPSPSPTIGQPPTQQNDKIFIGEITKIEGRHLFVISEGETYEIVLSDHTYFKKGKRNDLKVDTKLGIIGNPDGDGTYIARTIMLNASSSEELLKR